MNKDDITPIQNEGKSTPETIINTKTKELIEKRIVNVVAQIMDSDNRIKEIESYRTRLIIVKETLKDILKEIVELQSPDGDDGRVQPGQKSHAEIIPVPQSSDSSASGDISEAGGQDNPEPKEIHLPAEIIPFKEAEAFTYNKLQFFKQVGKIKVFLSGCN